MDNNVKSLIKRTVLFLLFPKIGLFGMLLIPGIIGVVLGEIAYWGKHTDFLDGIEYVYYSMFILSPFAHYLYAKIFGLFKVIDNLNLTLLKKLYL